MTDTYKRRIGENLSARKCGQSTRELIEGMIEISPLKSTIKTRGAFHLRKKPGNFGGSKSGISDW